MTGFVSRGHLAVAFVVAIEILGGLAVYVCCAPAMQGGHILACMLYFISACVITCSIWTLAAWTWYGVAHLFLQLRAVLSTWASRRCPVALLQAPLRACGRRHAITAGVGELIGAARFACRRVLAGAGAGQRRSPWTRPWSNKGGFYDGCAVACMGTFLLGFPRERCPGVLSMYCCGPGAVVTDRLQVLGHRHWRPWGRGGISAWHPILAPPLGTDARARRSAPHLGISRWEQHHLGASACPTRGSQCAAPGGGSGRS